MAEKIKVNLSYHTYSCLLDDMASFECFKPNGDLNRNLFLNVLLGNLYYYKVEKRGRMKKLLEERAILDGVSEKNKKKMIEEACSIMDNDYNEDIDEKYHNEYFMIYPTRITEGFFDYIYENEIRLKTTASSFIRSMLNEYVLLPKVLREQIIKRRELNKIFEAIDKGVALSFRRGCQTYRIAPYCICPSRGESGLYLLGIDLNSASKKPVSFSLTKIFEPVVTKEKCELSNDKIDNLEEIISTGVEYASSDIMTVTISLTSGGMRMLQAKAYGRPMIEKIGDNIYKTSCSLSNFINYFIPFGKEIEILDNQDIKNRFAAFYEAACKKHSN